MALDGIVWVIVGVAILAILGLLVYFFGYLFGLGKRRGETVASTKAALATIFMGLSNFHPIQLQKMSE